MVLLKVFLVLCFVAYGRSLNVNSDVDAKSNSKIRIMERRGMYVKSSAYLELYFFFSKWHKERVRTESVYLKEFVKQMNQIFETQKNILHVTFSFLKASVWNPSKKAYTSQGFLDAEELKRQLKKQANKVEKHWNKTHPYKPITAFVFLTTEKIQDKTRNPDIVSGISGRIGGICLLDEKIAAATDNGSFSGVRAAALQLSILMGSVYDGQKPPGKDFVRGSDGAQDCKPEDGYLMGKWNTNGNSFKLSYCSPHQHIMGLRQRGPTCYGNSEEKKELLKRGK
uniref:Putative tick metalloprotease n=2 Tax=Ixodes ricinus TaxID=34613 RepID=V5IDA7_IXORI